MELGRIAVGIAALALGIGGLVAITNDDGAETAANLDPIQVASDDDTDKGRKDDGDDVLTPVEEDDDDRKRKGDGDGTRGDDGTGGGNNTGGTNSASKDGTMSKGWSRDGKTSDGDGTWGNDRTGGGDNSGGAGVVGASASYSAPAAGGGGS